MQAVGNSYAPVVPKIILMWRWHEYFQQFSYTGLFHITLLQLLRQAISSFSISLTDAKNEEQYYKQARVRHVPLRLPYNYSRT
jgi:hypothetical protein